MLLVNICCLIVSVIFFCQRNGEIILEVVSTDGKELPGSQGRVMNPGQHYFSPLTFLYLTFIGISFKEHSCMYAIKVFIHLVTCNCSNIFFEVFYLYRSF